jgi:hypothetical protein
VQIDLPQLLALDPSSGLGALRVVAVRDQHERFPGGFEAVLELAFRRAEHERVRSQRCSSLQDRRQSPARIERNPTVLPVLRVDAPNDDLVLRPVHVAVLDAQPEETARWAKASIRMSEYAQWVSQRKSLEQAVSTLDRPDRSAATGRKARIACRTASRCANVNDLTRDAILARDRRWMRQFATLAFWRGV